MNNPLPTECKDLAFARNLIRQMNGEGGRHNSTVNRARVSASVANDTVESQQMRAPAHDRQERVRFEPDVNARPPYRPVNASHLEEYLEAMRRSTSDMFGMPPGYFGLARSMIEREQGTADPPREQAASEYIMEANRRLDREQAAIDARHHITGRWGNHYIRSDAQHCEIGDAFPFNGEGEDYQWSIYDGYFQVIRRNSREQFDLTRMIFKKIGVAVTPDNGRTWREEYFWERVE